MNFTSVIYNVCRISIWLLTLAAWAVKVLLLSVRWFLACKCIYIFKKKKSEENPCEAYILSNLSLKVFTFLHVSIVCVFTFSYCRFMESVFVCIVYVVIECYLIITIQDDYTNIHVHIFFTLTAWAVKVLPLLGLRGVGNTWSSLSWWDCLPLTRPSFSYQS